MGAANIKTIAGHILIVEDNLINQRLVCKLIDKTGLTYDLATDGVQAVEMFKQHRYQLILMDENMPNLSGTKATQQIRALERCANIAPTPIIALTANALTGDREKFIASGMDEYLSKPIDIPRLFQLLADFINA